MNKSRYKQERWFGRREVHSRESKPGQETLMWLRKLEKLSQREGKYVIPTQTHDICECVCVCARERDRECNLVA